MARAQDYLAGLLGRCEGSSADTKGAALTMNTPFDVNADDGNDWLFCVDVCALESVCQTANCWNVRKRVAC